MTYETRKAYSEVCVVLDYMPNEYINKIPKKIIKLFKDERLENYEPNINKSNPLDKNYLSKKTMVLIAMLNYQYWCPNKNLKEELYKKYLSNNEKYQKEIDEKYPTDNLFKNRKAKICNEDIIDSIEKKEENISLIKYEEDRWYQKIFNAIKRLFYKKS